MRGLDDHALDYSSRSMLAVARHSGRRDETRRGAHVESPADGEGKVWQRPNSYATAWWTIVGRTSRAALHKTATNAAQNLWQTHL